MRRGRNKPLHKRHTRRRASAAKLKRDKLERERTGQKPATAADLDRLGRHAVEEARVDNAKRIQREIIRDHAGQLYHRKPGGPFVKTSGRAVLQEDGTLRPLSPDPRPTKRERAKAKRQLKREALDAEKTSVHVRGAQGAGQGPQVPAIDQPE